MPIYPKKKLPETVNLSQESKSPPFLRLRGELYKKVQKEEKAGRAGRQAGRGEWEGELVILVKFLSGLWMTQNHLNEKGREAS